MNDDATEERAQRLLDAHNRTRAALLAYRAELEVLEQLSHSERWALGEALDPVGKLLVFRESGDTSRPLVYGDAEELFGHVGVIRGKLGFLLERYSVLGDTIKPAELTPRVIPEREPEVPAWEKQNNELMEYGIGWNPGPDGNIHNI